MKKFFTLIAALVLASSLSMPAFAKTKKHHHSKKHHATSQAHKKHAKKKGATHGKKKGQ